MSDPTASPGRGGKPLVAALVVALVALSGLLATTAVLARPRDPFPVNPATALLPPDGHREIRVEGDAWTIREYAFSAGAPMLATGPAALALAVDDFEALLASSWLRILETTVEGTGTTGHRVTALEITDRGVLRRIDVAGDLISRWEPAPVLLPTSIEVGARWRSTGSVYQFDLAGNMEMVSYDFAAEVSSPEDPARSDEGCLDILRTERTGENQHDRAETWCPGLGIVSGDDISAEGPDAPPPGLEFLPAWHPGDWRPETTDLNAAPPMTWGTGLPVVGTADVLVVGHEVTGDINFAPDGDVTRAYRAHPGGRLTALAGFGELIVATTTRAQAVAYDIGGTWQWQVDLPDVVVMTPALVSGNVVLVDGSGRITAVDALTGREVWRTSLSNQVISDPQACGHLTVLGTTGNEVVVLDSSGAEVSATQVSERASQFVCNGAGEIIAAAGSRLERITADGRHLGSVPMRDATINDMFVSDGMVITFSASALTAYDDETLARLWRVEHRYGDVAVADGHIVAIDTERIVALEDSGRELASWPSGAHLEGMSIHLVPHESGVGVLSPELEYTRLR